MTAEDREYVERALTGEPAAFEALVRKYNRMAGAIAYGIVGDFSAADDIVQEAFLKAFRSLGDLREADKFKVWLGGIVRSRAIDWLRRRKALAVVPFSQAFGDGGEGDEEAAGRPLAEGLGPDALFQREELRGKVLDAIRALPPEDREVVTLKHMDGLSYREIAEMTGATVSAVESRLFRARQALRKKLERIVK